jgi:hypothetical protein
MNACIIEYNDFHDETIPSIVFVLNNLGYDVDIYLTDNNINKQLFNVFSNDLKFSLKTVKTTGQHLPFLLNKIYLKYYKLIKGISALTGTLDTAVISQRKYDVIIFNSVEPLDVLYKTSDYHKSHVFYILHNAYLLQKHSEYIKIIDINKTFVLSQHINNYFSKNLKVLSPVYFGNIYKESAINPSCIKFCVQGNFDSKRRNYISLIDAIKRFQSENIINFKIEILGNSNNEEGLLFKDAVNRNSLSQYFTLYNYILPYKQYYEVLVSSDYVLPLLDDSSLYFNSYLLWKCSSSINAAIGLGIVPCLNMDFAAAHNLQNASITYLSDDLYSAIKTALYKTNEEYSILQSNLKQIKNELLLQNFNNLRNAIAK